MRSLRMLLLAACTAAGIASPANAVEIHGTSSTQAQWFTNYFNNQKQFEIGQYVNASVTTSHISNLILVVEDSKNFYTAGAAIATRGQANCDPLEPSQLNTLMEGNP